MRRQLIKPTQSNFASATRFLFVGCIAMTSVTVGCSNEGKEAPSSSPIAKPAEKDERNHPTPPKPSPTPAPVASPTVAPTPAPTPALTMHVEPTPTPRPWSEVTCPQLKIVRPKSLSNGRLFFSDDCKIAYVPPRFVDLRLQFYPFKESLVELSAECSEDPQETLTQIENGISSSRKIALELEEKMKTGNGEQRAQAKKKLAVVNGILHEQELELEAEKMRQANAGLYLSLFIRINADQDIADYKKANPDLGIDFELTKFITADLQLSIDSLPASERVLKRVYSLPAENDSFGVHSTYEFPIGLKLTRTGSCELLRANRQKPLDALKTTLKI